MFDSHIQRDLSSLIFLYPTNSASGYNAANQKTDAGTQSIDIDVNGNVTNDGRYAYVWNAFDQLIEVKTLSGSILKTYRYDENGRRVYSKDNNGETYYRYNGLSNQVLFEEDASGVIIKSYTYDDSGLPLTMTYRDKTYYYLTNYRGDVLALTDEIGTIVAKYTYDAWGNILTQKDLDQEEDINLAKENPYRYAGYRYDEETKLYYLMARYYNPDTGVFLSLDPVSGDTMNSITLNGYNYANNNPVMTVDPDGELSVRTSFISNMIDWLILAIPFAGGMAASLKILSKVPKAYRMSNGYKVVPKIQINVAKYLSRFGVKASIATLVIGFAINSFNLIADFSIGKAVVAGLKYYFKSEKKNVKKYGYWGANKAIEYINFSKRK